ncbi:MAG TPA: trypsin-like peptidase domain-containing protein [Gemmatales bacterium]|nr:trypsin-like peptidase domain-containing protein [Gemmatales bacterium]
MKTNILLATFLTLPVVCLAQTPTTPVVTDVVALSERFQLVSKKVAPAVVSIEARKMSTIPNAKKQIEDSGSGVIVKLDNRPGYYVLTNNHIVENAPPENIILQLADGKLLQPKKVFTYPHADVAVLFLDVGESLPHAPLGDSDKLQQGNWVLAIGSPFSLSQSLTHGIVSALGRGQVNLGSEIHIKDFIQSDAAINPGSSGGPLINLQGEVVGINTAIASPSGTSSGIAFSIPINYFKKAALQLIDKGFVSRGYIGIQLAISLDPWEAQKMGLDRGWGALIEDVRRDGPAMAAGLQRGDVILEINQQLIRNENHCINTISALPIGKPAMFVVWRDRRRQVVQCTVEDYAVKFPGVKK